VARHPVDRRHGRLQAQRQMGTGRARRHVAAIDSHVTRLCAVDYFLCL
jgi:hypothetical protein